MKTRLLLVCCCCVALAFVSVMAGVPVDAYKTAVVDEDGSRLKLRNEVEVKVTSSAFRGVGGGGADCILIKDGMHWQIWIEGEGLYDCDVDERLTSGAQPSELGRILTMAYNGEVMLMEDGSIYEVENRDTFHTGRWLDDSKAIVIEDSLIVNLDTRQGIVRVQRLRQAP